MTKIISVLLYAALGGLLFTAVAAGTVVMGAEPCPWVNSCAFGAVTFGLLRWWYFAQQNRGQF